MAAPGDRNVGSWVGRAAWATGRPRLPCRRRVRALTLLATDVVGAVDQHREVGDQWREHRGVAVYSPPPISRGTAASSALESM